MRRLFHQGRALHPAHHAGAALVFSTPAMPSGLLAGIFIYPVNFMEQNPPSGVYYQRITAML